MENMTPQPKHTTWTKLAHAGLALAVIIQLMSSLAMRGPRNDRPGDWLYDIHQYSGLSALLFATAFWLVLLFRRRGTVPALLFPWFSRTGRQKLWRDMVAHALALRFLRLPAYDDHAPLSSAVHGLGLLLMSFLAASGAAYYAVALVGSGQAVPVRLILFAHTTFANVAWAYLIGHAFLGALHHYLRHMSLGDMWALHRPVSSKGDRS